MDTLVGTIYVSLESRKEVWAEIPKGGCRQSKARLHLSNKHSSNLRNFKEKRFLSHSCCGLLKVRWDHTRASQKCPDCLLLEVDASKCPKG